MTENKTLMMWSEWLVGEMLVCNLLGRLLYDPLDKDWLQSLIDEDVFNEVPFGANQAATVQGLERLNVWAKSNKAAWGEDAFDDLRADCTRLFVGVGRVPAPPWESVYFSEDRMVFQEQTLQVRSWYRRFGLETEKIHQEPDDHIGLELMFLAHLAALSMQALERGDEEQFEQHLQAQREFFQSHLGAWVLTWCALVEQNARTDFYRGLAHLIRGTVTALSEILDVSLNAEVAVR